MPDDLSPELTERLIEILDCIVTLRRGADDRSSEVGIVVATSWDPDVAGDADRALLARHTHRASDSDGWQRARVAALYGHRLDLTAPDVLDQADEISAASLAIAERLHPERGTVLALEQADWFPPFDIPPLARATLDLTGRTVSGLCDRLAYLLGDHLRLVTTDQPEPPPLEHPLDWWTARGWRSASDSIVTWRLGQR